MISKLHRSVTESFKLIFFSNVVKTKNLRGIRISEILEDHLFEIIFMYQLVPLCRSFPRVASFVEHFQFLFDKIILNQGLM